MLHPTQFQVNEAWIAFRLNDAPIHTESDGDFNCVALMDAASCFILTTASVPTSQTEPSILEARRMLKKGYAHKQEMPKTLFIPSEQPANNLALEAKHRKVTVVRVPELQLAPIIGEARKSFNERFGGGLMQ